MAVTQADWQQIKLESKMLKELAVSGHWPNFLSLSEARLKHMKAFFAELEHNNSDFISEIMDDIQDIRRTDEEIFKILEQQQSALAGDLSALQEGMRMIQAYRSVT